MDHFKNKIHFFQITIITIEYMISLSIISLNLINKVNLEWQMTNDIR